MRAAPQMAAWQGPALLCYNNSTFTPADFHAISRIGQDSKLERPAATGVRAHTLVTPQPYSLAGTLGDRSGTYSWLHAVFLASPHSAMGLLHDAHTPASLHRCLETHSNTQLTKLVFFELLPRRLFNIGCARSALAWASTRCTT